MRSKYSSFFSKYLLVTAIRINSQIGYKVVHRMEMTVMKSKAENIIIYINRVSHFTLPVYSIMVPCSDLWNEGSKHNQINNKIYSKNNSVYNPCKNAPITPVGNFPA